MAKKVFEMDPAALEKTRASKREYMRRFMSLEKNRLAKLEKDRKSRERLRADPSWVERQKAYQRDYALRRRYGITMDDYLAAEHAQDGRCAICGVDGGGALCVDHDHDSGNVRGLLCNECNSAIGLLKEDVDVLDSAIRYLEYWQRLEAVR